MHGPVWSCVCGASLVTLIAVSDGCSEPRVPQDVTWVLTGWGLWPSPLTPATAVSFGCGFRGRLECGMRAWG